LMMVYDVIGFHQIVPVSIKQRLFDTFLFRYGARHAEGIIASLASTKEDIVASLGIAPQRVHVVMPSVSAEFTEHTDNLDSVLSKYGLEQHGYVLYIGNERPHKNLPGALAIMRHLYRTYDVSVPFCLVGGPDTPGGARSAVREALDGPFKDLQA